MGRKQTEGTKEKIRKSLLKWHKENPQQKYNYICSKCGLEFKRTRKIKKDRPIHCDICKRKVVHYNRNIKSLNDCSKRTTTKILKRSNKGCEICGWNEAVCDLHHIIPKSKGGKDLNSNFIIVCPNCHRIIHHSNNFSEEFLLEKSVENTFKDWIKYYNI